MFFGCIVDLKAFDADDFDGGHDEVDVNDDVDGDDDDDDPDFVQGVDLRGCFFSLQAWLAGCHIHTSKVSS